MTALVCTRNRGRSVVQTVESILANNHPDFELVLVDQSTNDETAEAIAPLLSDSRFRYVRSHTQGAGLAHNIGLEQGQGQLVVCTDDDCTVPPDWLEGMVAPFEINPRIGVVFCNVLAAPHDTKTGYIPAYIRKTDVLVRSLWEKRDARGIGAGMAFRRDVVEMIGGFDAALGPGSYFGACNDGDVTVRALAKGWYVYETVTTHVVHYGFRTFDEGRKHVPKAWRGTGASYSKLLRSKPQEILPVLIYEGWLAMAPPLGKLLRLQRPSGLRDIFSFLRGIIEGAQIPLDRDRIVYRLNDKK